MTKRQLLNEARLSSEEFEEWAAFYSWEAKEHKRQQEIAESKARIRRR